MQNKAACECLRVCVPVSVSQSVYLCEGNNKWPGHWERKLLLRLLLQDAGPGVIIQMEAASYKLEIVSDLAGRKTRKKLRSIMSRSRSRSRKAEGAKPKQDRVTITMGGCSATEHYWIEFNKQYFCELIPTPFNGAVLLQRSLECKYTFLIRLPGLIPSLPKLHCEVVQLCAGMV